MLEIKTFQPSGGGIRINTISEVNMKLDTSNMKGEDLLRLFHVVPIEDEKLRLLFEYS